jgi:hypothetical protein
MNGISLQNYPQAIGVIYAPTWLHKDIVTQEIKTANGAWLHKNYSKASY